MTSLCHIMGCHRKKGKYEKCSLGQVIQKKVICFCYFGIRHTASIYQGADKSIARPTSRCILFDGKNISFDASLVTYLNSTNIPPVMIINKIHEHQNLLSV